MHEDSAFYGEPDFAAVPMPVILEIIKAELAKTATTIPL